MNRKKGRRRRGVKKKKEKGRRGVGRRKKNKIDKKEEMKIRRRVK